MDLAGARLYLVAGARLGAGELAAMVPELATAGVDVIQLREKDMEAGDILRVGEPVAAACRAAGVPFIVNDRPDVALALEADGVHLGQNDLPVEVARRVVGASIVGLSTHTPNEVESAAGLDVDYVAVGPVHATPTKPGRPAAGVGLIRHAASSVKLPWFAIGGIEASNLAEVVEAGARRVVVVRAVAEAADPPRAAAELRAILEGAPL